MKTKLLTLVCFSFLINSCNISSTRENKEKSERSHEQGKGVAVNQKFIKSEERVKLYYSGLINRNYRLSESIKGGEKVPRFDTLDYKIDSIKLTKTNYARNVYGTPSMPGDIEVFVKVYLNNNTRYKMAHFTRAIKGKRYILFSRCESGVVYPAIPEFNDKHFFLTALDSSYKHFSSPLNTLKIHFSSCENNNFNLFLKTFGNEISTTKHIMDCNSFMPDTYHIKSRKRSNVYKNNFQLPIDSIYTLINYHGEDSSTHKYIFRNVGIYWFLVEVYGELATPGDALGT